LSAQYLQKRDAVINKHHEIVTKKLFAPVFRMNQQKRTPNTNQEKCMKKLAALVFIALIGFSAVQSYAHSGGTDKNGCHRDHKNGGKHCH
jgi:hypothetical protein